MVQWINKIDKQLLLAINSHHKPFWDGVMWFASGELSWIPLYALLLLLLVVKYKKQSWLIILLLIPLMALSDQLCTSIIKPLAVRLRPSHEPALENILHYVCNYRGGTYGFVSNHSCNVFALTTYLSFVTANQLRWLSYLLFPWALLVAYSRIYLGVHYPTDVFVAAILGIVLGYFVSRIYDRFKSMSQPVKT